jgi:hypothetical protein
MQHLYGVESSATTNTSATNILTANTSSEELCSVATDDMTLSNELQKAMAAVSNVQISTSKTAKEFEFGSLKKKINLFETSGVRTPNLDMLLHANSYVSISKASREVFQESLAVNFMTLNYSLYVFWMFCNGKALNNKFTCFYFITC